MVKSEAMPPPSFSPIPAAVPIAPAIILCVVLNLDDMRRLPNYLVLNLSRSQLKVGNAYDCHSSKIIQSKKDNKMKYTLPKF